MSFGEYFYKLAEWGVGDVRVGIIRVANLRQQNIRLDGDGTSVCYVK